MGTRLTCMLVPFIMLQVNASLIVFGVTSSTVLAPYTRIPIDTSGCSSEYVTNIVASFQDHICWGVPIPIEFHEKGEINSAIE